MNDRSIAVKSVAVLDSAEWGSTEHDVALFALWRAMTPGHHEQLHQLLFHGPVADGDVLSKSFRSDLIALGLAVRCCSKGEQGYTAASYRAYTVWKAAHA